MARKPLSYLDAVKLLGGDSRTVAGLSRVAGVGLAVASAGSSAALSLFGLKDEVERLGQEGVVALRKRFAGLNRFKRSELIEAAHAVLVVSAFFAALDDLSDDLYAALDTASLELTKAEQATLASGSGAAPGSVRLGDLAREFSAPGVIPGLGAGWADRGCDLKAYYSDLARRVRGFAAGTSVWDKQDETTRTRWTAGISDELPQRALARYEERLGQLAAEFPEFAFWAHRVGVQTVLDELYAVRRDNAELGQVVQTLAMLMQSATPEALASTIRSDLVTRYRKQLDRPIAGAVASAIPDEVTLPHLRELYVNPSYRMLPRAQALTDEEWVSERSWQEVMPGGDLWALVLEHLISTDATQRTLPLDEGTVNALRELRKLQRKERMAAGEAYRPGSHGGYVAADEIGAGYSTQRLRGTFYRLVESAGLRRITFYHARHSALSYLLNSGQVTIAVVAAWAGHADGGATALKHYIRVRPGDLEAARDAIAALLGA